MGSHGDRDAGIERKGILTGKMDVCVHAARIVAVK